MYKVCRVIKGIREDVKRKVPGQQTFQTKETARHRGVNSWPA